MIKTNEICGFVTTAWIKEYLRFVTRKGAVNFLKRHNIRPTYKVGHLLFYRRSDITDIFKYV